MLESSFEKKKNDVWLFLLPFYFNKAHWDHHLKSPLRWILRFIRLIKSTWLWWMPSAKTVTIGLSSLVNPGIIGIIIVAASIVTIPTTATQIQVVFFFFWVHRFWSSHLYCQDPSRLRLVVWLFSKWSSIVLRSSRPKRRSSEEQRSI